MSDINQVVISGRLGRDPEVRYVGANNTALCELSVAVGSGRKKPNGEWENETDWISVKCWNKTAEKCGSLASGQKVVASGKMKTDEWEDRETGKKRSKTYLLAFAVEQLDVSCSYEDSSSSQEPAAVSDNQEEVPF